MLFVWLAELWQVLLAVTLQWLPVILVVLRLLAKEVFNTYILLSAPVAGVPVHVVFVILFYMFLDFFHSLASFLDSLLDGGVLELVGPASFFLNVNSQLLAGLFGPIFAQELVRIELLPEVKYCLIRRFNVYLKLMSH